MEDLLADIRNCEVCIEYLPLGPRPIVTAHPKSKIAIIGQAPGTKVHASGIPWDDASGKRLREWLGVTDAQFYNEEMFALVPMGFCYPGKGRSGDLPPRSECAPLWHTSLMKQMPELELALLIGNYSQGYYLKDKKGGLTERVMHYNDYLPRYFPLPHPSPRNRFWLTKNPWFEKEVIPELQKRILEILLPTNLIF